MSLDLDNSPAQHEVIKADTLSSCMSVDLVNKLSHTSLTLFVVFILFMVMKRGRTMRTDQWKYSDCRG